MSTSKKEIAIGSDHAGYTYKKAISSRLAEKGYTVTDHGTFNEESIDYPPFAHLVAEDVLKGKLGILICGSGNGVNMTANKHSGVRSALCWNKEVAELARLHNDANIMALPARFVSLDEAIEMVEVFLSTEFEGGRHARRVDQINCR